MLNCSERLVEKISLGGCGRHGLKEGFVRGKELRSGRLLMVKCGCSWKVATRVEVDFFSFFLCNLRLENYWDVWMHYIIWEALYYLI